MNRVIKKITRAYKILARVTLKPVTKILFRACLGFLDNRSWVPVFYFLLPRANTNALSVLHVLNHIQVTTGRSVIAVTTWPFWPWETQKDPQFTSFVRGLNPKIRYLWIPVWLGKVVRSLVVTMARLVQLNDIQRPLPLNATLRFSESSTIDHSDILASGNRVVFHIPKSHEHFLEQQLADIGVSPNDWFVCVHARESGWVHKLKAYDLKWPPDFKLEMSDHMNVDIADYFPAIDYIVSQGGLVIRMGDTSMKRVEGIDGLIDYPFTKHKNMLMDLYILSRSRFVIGCTSGFSSSFVSALGKPLLMTNWPAPVFSCRLPYDNALVMLRSTVEKATGRTLSLREMFQPKLCISMNDLVMAEDMGYESLPNTPQDILDCTREMHHLVESESFDQTRTREQEFFHQYRLETLDFLRYTGYRDNWSSVRAAESRLSATFGAQHFAGEEYTPINVDASQAQREVRMVHYGGG